MTEKKRKLADITGKLLECGDEIILTDWIYELNEPVYTKGKVTEKNNKYYLNNRELELLDIFIIIPHGKEN